MAKTSTETDGLGLEQRRTLFKAYVNKNLDTNIFTVSKDEVVKISRLPFDHPELDNALGGGLPKGRIVEIYGPESSGKTTLCLEAIVKSQQEDPKNHALFIDAENSLDVYYAVEGVGVDPSRLDVVPIDDMEQAAALLGKAVESQLYSIIVFDSTAVKVKAQQGEINYTDNDSGISKEARILSMCLGKLTKPIKDSGMIVFFTSQIRSKSGPSAAYGNPNVPTGGNALKFYASIRMEIRQAGLEKIGEEAVGVKIHMKVDKNKTAVPKKECDYYVVFGQGLDRLRGTIEDAINKGVIEKSGAWFKYNGETIAQGMINLRELLEHNEGLVKEIKERCADE